MRFLSLLVPGLLCLTPGCRRPGPTDFRDIAAPPRAAATVPAPAKTTNPPPRRPIVTPGANSGTVAMVSDAGQFAIVTFAPGALPRPGTHLNVYRGGLKVGQLRATRPQRDLSTSADLVTGSCHPGDEVRED